MPRGRPTLPEDRPCSQCERALPRDDFYTRTNGRRDSVCKACRTVLHRQRRAAARQLRDEVDGITIPKQNIAPWAAKNRIHFEAAGIEVERRKGESKRLAWHVREIPFE